MRTPFFSLALIYGCGSSTTLPGSLVTTGPVLPDSAAENGVDGCTNGGVVVSSGVDDGTPSGTALNGLSLIHISEPTRPY